MSGHEVVTAPELAPPVGYAHAVVAAPGRAVYLGGQTALDPDGKIAGDTLAEQFDQAAGNVVAALARPAARPTTWCRCRSSSPTSRSTAARWRSSRRCGASTSGATTPPPACSAITRLFDVEAKIELMAVAVRPE